MNGTKIKITGCFCMPGLVNFSGKKKRIATICQFNAIRITKHI